jgi:MPBQ/MSBQ methyltransferase
MFKWNPKLWYKVTREIVTLERMHQAFDKGLMQYGLMRGMKKAAVGASSSGSSSSQQPAAATAGSS